jgi:hypothetical protein
MGSIVLGFDAGTKELGENSSVKVKVFPIGARTLAIETKFFVTLGEEALPFWTEEMCKRCLSAESVEVHLPRLTGEVYKSLVTSLSQIDGILQMDLKLHPKDISRSATYFNSFKRFDLDNARKPKIIKEDGWDLIQFSFEGGHVVIYFSKPA